MDQALQLAGSIAEVRRQDGSAGLGTAFCIAPGFWLTAYHVVQQTNSVLLARAEGVSAPACVVAIVETLDAALLACSALEAEPLALSRSAPCVGTVWRTFGYPLPEALRADTGTRLPVEGVYAGESQQSALLWVRSTSIAQGVSGAPICSGEPPRAWGFVSEMLTAELSPGRAEDFNVSVAIGAAVDALLAALPQSEVAAPVPVCWSELEHDDLRLDLTKSGWTVLWHAASDPVWRQRLTHDTVPYFVYGDRPEPLDVARGDILPRRSAVEAADFLFTQSSCSVAVIRGSSASGKSSLALLIAWELHRRGVLVLEALDEARSLRAATTLLPNKRLLLVIEDAHFRKDLLERLRPELQGCSSAVSLLIVNDAPLGTHPSPYYAELMDELAADCRLKIVDAGPNFSEVHEERIARHVDQVFARWQLKGRVSREQLPALLEDVPVARAIKGLFTTISRSAQAHSEAAETKARPSWLTAKLMEWTAISFAADVVLPIPLAQRAAPLLPDELAAGSFDDLQWTARGFSFGHSEQARGFVVADRVERELELVDAALATGQAQFLMGFIESVQVETLGRCRKRLASLPNGTVLRASEVTLLLGLFVAGQLDDKLLQQHLERFIAPSDRLGLSLYITVLGRGLAREQRSSLLVELLLRRVRDLAARTELGAWRDALAQAIRTAHRYADKRSDLALAGRLLVELRDLVNLEHASEEQRTELAGVLLTEHLRARKAGAPAVTRGLLQELRALAAREAAPAEQRSLFGIALFNTHLDASRACDSELGAHWLGELRALAAREGANEEQRALFGDALFCAYRDARRMPAGEQAAGLLDELRALASREQADETLRTTLAMALLFAHREASKVSDDESAERALAELRELAGRDSAHPAQLEQLAIALFNAYAQACEAGETESAASLLAELRTVSQRPQCDEEARIHFTAALHKAQLEARKAGAVESAASLLEELRAVSCREQASERQRTRFARALLDNFTSACEVNDPDFAARSLADLRALAARDGASDEQRVLLAKALFVAHLDARKARAADVCARVLDELRALARSEQVHEDTCTWLATALYNARVDADRAGDRALSAKLLDELRALAGCARANEELRAMLANAILNAHADACAAADSAAAATALQELRALAARDSANQAQRTHLATALYNAHALAYTAGDDDACYALLEELSVLAGRASAREEQRSLLSKALNRRERSLGYRSSIVP